MARLPLSTKSGEEI
ncbi:hypothetical protein EE612_054071 [Oryza sativa]|nr:hypothetical protein EE612_054071 [Oryza sativa]